VSFTSKRFDSLFQVRELSASGGAFADSTVYNCLISGVSQDGVALGGDTTLQFTTTDVRPPTVLFTDPANGAAGVINQQPTDVAIKFSEAMDPVQTLAATTMSGVPSFAGTWSEGNTRLTMRYEDVVSGGDTVSVSITTAARDVIGNALAAPFSASHTRANTAALTLSSSGAMDGHFYRADPSPYTYQLNAAAATTGLIGTTGPTGTRQRHRSVLSFDLSTLPNNLVIISSATITVCMSAKTGAPAGGTLQAESIDYSAFTDAAALFTNASDGLAPCTTEWLTQSQGGLTCDVTSLVRADWQNRASNGSRTQFRMRFANDELMGLSVAGGNLTLSTTEGPAVVAGCPAIGGRPRLDISYQYP
jgi:hypothetical protein